MHLIDTANYRVKRVLSLISAEFAPPQIPSLGAFFDRFNVSPAVPPETR